MILAFLPWLDTSRVRSANYRPLYRQFFWIFVLVCLGLGWLGSKPAEGGYVIAARILTALLLRALPHHPAAARLGREDQAAAELDLGGGPEEGLPVGASGPAPTTRARGRPMARSVLALVLAGSLLGLAAIAPPALAADARGAGAAAQKWSFAGPFGKFDRGQLQRGFKVYKEVCAACHGLKLRGVPQPRRPGGLTSEAQVKAIAAEYKVQDGPNDQGEMFERDGRPADHFPTPWPNENAARARYNGGAARHVGARQGAQLRARLPVVHLRHVHPVPGAWRRLHRRAADRLQGEAAGRLHAAAGLVLQRIFPRPCHRACRRRLSDKRVDYTDGSPTTVDQYSKDVAAFMMWAAEPHLEARKRIGFQVMIFLIVLAGLLYFTKKKVWADAH